MWTVEFPPAVIRETAASMITCVAILLLSYTCNLSAHSTKSNQWLNKVNLQCYEPSELSVSVILPRRLSPSVAYLHSLSEFIGRVDNGFQHPLVVKYSHEADAPLRTLKNKFDNRKRSEQTLRLALSGW